MHPLKSTPLLGVAHEGRHLVALANDWRMAEWPLWSELRTFVLRADRLVRDPAYVRLLCATLPLRRAAHANGLSSASACPAQVSSGLEKNISRWRHLTFVGP